MPGNFTQPQAGLNKGIDNDPLLFTPFTPADLSHYTTWLEGYAVYGGTVHSFWLPEGSQNNTFSQPLAQWLGNTIFAINNFDSGQVPKGANIIVADNATYTGEIEGNHLMFFKDFSTRGLPLGPPMYATQEFVPIAQRLQNDFLTSFYNLMRARTLGPPGSHWPSLIREYRSIAEILHFDFWDEDIAIAKAKAER